MNKSEVNKIYKEKLNLIKKFNKFYYDESNPIVTDEEYDNLRRKK